MATARSFRRNPDSEVGDGFYLAHAVCWNCGRAEQFEVKKGCLLKDTSLLHCQGCECDSLQWRRHDGDSSWPHWARAQKILERALKGEE